ncbi:putative ribonuclease H protein, partial [Trifolium medium]|nr:putative ribonuclease H protein [Trifolium medium]
MQSCRFIYAQEDIFSFVQERVYKKIKGWKEKFLSRAGKETLIKAVAQAIPNYIMSCYKLPQGCCQNIEGYHPSYAWRSLLQPKDVIALGARWSIGNGHSVHIFKDNWIPKSPWDKAPVASEYSVRSAHHLLREEAKLLPENSSSRERGIWKKIWSIPIPKSSQNFLW